MHCGGTMFENFLFPFFFLQLSAGIFCFVLFSPTTIIILLDAQIDLNLSKGSQYNLVSVSFWYCPIGLWAFTFEHKLI